MNSLKDALQKAVQQTKSLHEMKGDFAVVVHEYDSYFDQNLIDQIYSLVTSVESLNTVLSRIIDSMIKRKNDLNQLSESICSSYHYVGIGDRLYDTSELILNNIHKDNDRIYLGIGEIKKQAQLLRLFLTDTHQQENTGGCQNRTLPQPSLINKSPKKTLSSPRESISDESLISSLTELGFVVVQNAVRKQLENLSQIDRYNLMQHLTKVTKGGGRSNPINPYLEVLFDDIARMKFSYTGPAYRLVYHKSNGEVIDILDHDSYMKKYVSRSY